MLASTLPTSSNNININNINIRAIMTVYLVRSTSVLHPRFSKPFTRIAAGQAKFLASPPPPPFSNAKEIAAAVSAMRSMRSKGGLLNSELKVKSEQSYEQLSTLKTTNSFSAILSPR
ncbi:hypothetical protein HGRIS_004344 [Hohenbuehelia grisea]|uniref:Uncharacterized protein n=1 Tax=Hohenbuehelia grisea TaxID=104357 RepID=A0ABR3IPH9_9AGAR